jgi:hypothetical protein
MEDVLQEICKVNDMKEAYMLCEVYDFIALIEAETSAKLKRIVLGIRGVKYVLSTLTLMAIS